MKQYYGLADCYGVESFLPYDSKARMPDLLIRAYANPQRKAIVFKATFTEEQVKRVTALLEMHFYHIALELIKELHEKGEILDFMISAGKKNYLKQIPNPSLDPYHKDHKKGGNEDA